MDMILWKRLRTVGAADVRNIRRDTLLAWVVAVPFLIALLYRFGIPPLAQLLRAEAGFDLVPYYPLLMGFFVLLAPTMIGMVMGFLLLDERDDQVLVALLVTPLPLSGYLAYRIAAPVAAGFVVTIAGYPLAGLAPLPVGDLLPIAAVAALTGPVTALFLAAFAANKVTGLALVKILNTINLLPAAAYFVDVPWQLAAGVVPAYWPMKMAWQATTGEAYALYALGGLAAGGLVIVLLARRLSGALHR